MYKSTHDSISATELVRNFSTAVDKVRMSGQSLYITKGTQTVAELSPPPKEGFPMNKLSELLQSLPKLGEDAEQMQKDLEIIRKYGELPENPWE
jgi:antitoxin (DNA-binding transcriptional repressor) of toxin-antitoxin stability system